MLANKRNNQVSGNDFSLSLNSSGSTLFLEMNNNWREKNHSSVIEKVAQALSNGTVDTLSIDTRKLKDADTHIINLFTKLIKICEDKGLNCNLENLADSYKSLIDLSSAVTARKGSKKTTSKKDIISRIGDHATEFAQEIVDITTFIGEAVIALFSLLRGKARMRLSDLVLIIEECGPRALPIVTLISSLVGLILAFIGAVQLSKFGAELYVANLVGLAMTRELGAVMAAIILAGRTGAAFAAELGTMQVNEELDALKTFGIDPIEFLVLPRMLALMLMMPLLCLYADLMGMLGGALISITILDLSPELYWNQTISAIHLSDFLFGVFKSLIFGVLIAVAGCLRGIQSGRTSADVGLAATSAVVTGIVLIVVTDAVFAVIANFLGV